MQIRLVRIVRQNLYHSIYRNWRFSFRSRFRALSMAWLIISLGCAWSLWLNKSIFNTLYSGTCRIRDSHFGNCERSIHDVVVPDYETAKDEIPHRFFSFFPNVDCRYGFDFFEVKDLPNGMHILKGMNYVNFHKSLSKSIG